MTEGDIISRYHLLFATASQRVASPGISYPIAITGEPDATLLLLIQVQAVSSGMYSPTVSSTLFTNQGFSLQVNSGLLLPFSAFDSIKFSTALIIAAIKRFVNRSIHVTFELFSAQQ